ncbi:FRG domain protein [Acinetobacter baumannii 146457]|nr:FRG domain protein [Acinetobacter baumannii 146457]
MPSYKTHHFDDAKLFWDQLRPEEIVKLIGHYRYPVYRGQGDSNWLLAPNSTRSFQKKSIFQQTEDEVLLILTFIDYCDNIGIQVPGLTPSIHKKLKSLLGYYDLEYKSKWPHPEFYEILAFAQHYGVSTRFLDWSYRSFVAIYFSASEAIKIMASEIINGINPNLERNLAVWILETAKINTISHNLGIPKPDSDFPINIVRIPSGINSHVAAQQGCFTILRDIAFKFDSEEIQGMSIFDSSRTIDTSDMFFIDDLHKFTIPYSQATELLKLCELYNVTAATLFPTATGAGFAVKDFQNIHTVENYLSSMKIAAVSK